MTDRDWNKTTQWPGTERPADSNVSRAVRFMAGRIEAIVDTLEPDHGFVLMVFPINTPEGQCQYVGNVDLDDFVTMLRVQLAAFERIQGGHA